MLTAGPAVWEPFQEEEAGRQACEATKGQGYEVAYEKYKSATSRSMDAFVKKANTLGYTWPR